jgi:hypothetical protein
LAANGERAGGNDISSSTGRITQASASDALLSLIVFRRTMVDGRASGC